MQQLRTRALISSRSAFALAATASITLLVASGCRTTKEPALSPPLRPAYSGQTDLEEILPYTPPSVDRSVAPQPPSVEPEFNIPETPEFDGEPLLLPPPVPSAALEKDPGEFYDVGQSEKKRKAKRTSWFGRRIKRTSRTESDSASQQMPEPKWQDRFKTLFGVVPEQEGDVAIMPVAAKGEDDSQQVSFSETSDNAEAPLVELGRPIFLDAGEDEAIVSSPATLLPLQFGDEPPLKAPSPLRFTDF
ncbi:hypothetical protein Pan189_05620 [Stratiformator vulcanicus]|uniref:Uncharacterized protein n=2 Tax=Stratiformator vulcanicus TaxID=2527980 RepID=A0A517QX86_9PLAN|nr:hypothetical protein Pan189_05620 [Stratiformator vulcanicus]